MIKLNKSDSQFDSLDSEIIYFVEKFGYLIRKMSMGYGNPFRELLCDRIYNTIGDFKDDLPSIIQELEENRLKFNLKRNKANVDTIGRQSDYKTIVSSKSDEVTKEIRKKIKSIQNTTSDKIKASSYIKPEKLSERPTELVVVEKPLSKQSRNIKYKASSILIPSKAMIKETLRFKQIKTMQKKRGTLNTESMPVQELTKWEKNRHKYNSDDLAEKYKGYS